ncbi:MAG: 4'-phosphopantetheinyl transferase superfamily protein [Nitriliruptoraceae bacterium]
MTDRVRWLSRGLDHVPEGQAWLSAIEIERLGRMRYAKRSSEFLVSRSAAKQAIAHAVGLPADDPLALSRIEVRHRPTGAPAPFVDGQPAGLAMSSTDRADRAVCVVTAAAGIAIGCDLELVEERSQGFVASYLTPLEQQVVAAAPVHDLTANLIWSAKESALKVLETGLRRDTRSVEVRLGDEVVAGWSALEVHPAEGGVFPGWWRRAGRFLLSVGASAPVAPPVAFEEPDGLATATPTHRWLEAPLRSGPPPEPT